MRWWRAGLGVALLIWVLGAAAYQARRRGHRIGSALVLFAGAVFCFLAAAFLPRPPVTDAEAGALVVASVALLALAMAVVLVQGFVRLRGRPGR